MSERDLIEPGPGTVWTLHGKEVALLSASGFGGALYSLVWNGREFLNWSTTDLGRELQSAWQLEGLGERYNPTEAGGTGQTTRDTATEIISASTDGETLTTSVHPAFWQEYEGQRTSPDVLSKVVTVDYSNVTNLIRHDVKIEFAQSYSQSAIEVVTGYLERQFTNCYILEEGVLKTVPYVPVTDPSQVWIDRVELGTSPLILAVPDGSAAMGAWSNTGTQIVCGIAGEFNKWNASRLELWPVEGTHEWTVYYVVGTLDDVAEKMRTILVA